MDLISQRRALSTLLAATAFFTAAHAQYRQTNLVSDGFLPAVQIDPNLVNPWGMAFAPTGPFWIANNGTDNATLYNGAGTPWTVGNPLVVTLPEGSGPTGQVFSYSNEFMISNGVTSGPARFIFVNENGTISGWNPLVNPTATVQAVLTLPIPGGADAPIYKGAAIARTGQGMRLYATDFHGGTVHMFDGNFTLLRTFTDPNIPSDYGPFGIKAVGGFLVVTYAKADEDREDDVAGAGLGFVDIFKLNGALIRRFASNGKLNAPWGITLAPHSFGRHHDRLLIGNFGDGLINAFDVRDGRFRGALNGRGGRPLRNEGLWDLTFGNGALGGESHDLYFTAGPGDEEHGLFGEIAFVGGD